MPPDVFDVAVIGDSLTGHLSALALAERGLRVVMMSASTDGQHIERIIAVPPTSVNDTAMSGDTFAARSWERAQQLGLQMSTRSYASKVTLVDDVFIVSDWDDQVVRAKTLVFAPAGHEPRVKEGQLHELLGLAVSADAWSDAPFVAKRNATAAVIGCGFRAAEEALQCVRAGVKDVVILCDGEPHLGSLHTTVQGAPIRIKRRTRLGRLHMGADNRLMAIDVIEGDTTSREPCALVFLARGVECDTTLIDPERANPHVILAGLANGIPSDDYPAMAADAQRIVLAICR